MIKQNIVCKNAKVKCVRKIGSGTRRGCQRIRVCLEMSSSMLCIPPQVKATVKNVRFTPKLSIRSIRYIITMCKIVTLVAT
jgi:hypothetical protein